MKTNNQKFAATYSSSAFYRFVAQGIIVDGRAGGLVLGRSMVDGGISVIRQHGDTFHLQFERAEGGDFVLRPGLRAPRFRTKAVQQPAAEFSHLLITSAEPDDKILWLTSDQDIVPREVAATRLRELTQLNGTDNPFLRCEVDDLFPAEERDSRFQS